MNGYWNRDRLDSYGRFLGMLVTIVGFFLSFNAAANLATASIDSWSNSGKVIIQCDETPREPRSLGEADPNPDGRVIDNHHLDKPTF